MTELENQAPLMYCPSCGRSTYHQIQRHDFEGANVVCFSCGSSYWTASRSLEGYPNYADDPLPRYPIL